MALWMRYEHGGAEGFGTLDGEWIRPHSGDLFSAPAPSGAAVALAEVRLLAPVRPGTFIGLWNNFHELAARLGSAIPTEPLYFLKSPGSLQHPEGAIVPPVGYTGKTLYEGELGIVIGRTCTSLTEAEAEAAIFGYTCVNDVTALDLLNADPSFPQWARAKSCDTYGPCGPAISSPAGPPSGRCRCGRGWWWR